MLLQNGIPQVVGGTPGSFWQVQTNLQLISNLIDLGMPVQAAIDAPRWTMGGQTSWSDSSLSLEARFGEAVMRYALAEARKEKGEDRVVLQSTAAGLKLYQQMGFRTVTKVAVYAS